jgi:hypothetical protein
MHQFKIITSKNLRSPPWLGRPLWNICVTNDHGYFPLVVNTFRSFPHSRLITGFVTRLTRQVPLVEQELLTLQEHLSSSPDFSGVRVTQYLYVLWIIVCPFVFFLLAIVLAVLLRHMHYDYPFGIFKLFLIQIKIC